MTIQADFVRVRRHAGTTHVDVENEGTTTLKRVSFELPSPRQLGNLIKALEFVLANDGASVEVKL